MTPKVLLLYFEAIFEALPLTYCVWISTLKFYTAFATGFWGRSFQLLMQWSSKPSDTILLSHRNLASKQLSKCGSLCISVGGTVAKNGFKVPSGYGNNGETLMDSLFLKHPVLCTTFIFMITFKNVNRLMLIIFCTQWWTAEENGIKQLYNRTLIFRKVGLHVHILRRIVLSRI